MRLFLTTTLIAFGLPSLAWAATQFPGYTPEQSEKYLTACVEKAKTQAPPFVSEQFFKRYCQCTLNYIQERVTYEEFRDMAKAKTNNQPLSVTQQRADTVLDESLKVCFARMGI